MDEFGLINRYFKSAVDPDMVGVGDDAAVLPVPQGMSLVVCKDVLIEGRHFFSDVDPKSLGHKSLAVNLSDLAAMGATPHACLLGLGLPRVNEAWVSAFAQGLLTLGKQWHCPLVGGDTVSTPEGITISVTAIGLLPSASRGLLRSAAKPGDDIWVSGSLGAADVALRILQQRLPDPEHHLHTLRRALEWPEPRVSLGQRLLGMAHAAIDISDGLLQDMSHILKASHVGATLRLDKLPVHPALATFDASVVGEALLEGGDVYELCFTAPKTQHEAVVALGQELSMPLTCIGEVTAGGGLLGVQADGTQTVLQPRGFNHFGKP